MFRAFINKLSQLAHFLKAALSEQDGLASNSRLIAFLTTFATIGWVTYLVIHTGTLPDLKSAAVFLAAGIGGYAANKVSDMIKGD